MSISQAYVGWCHNFLWDGWKDSRICRACFRINTGSLNNKEMWNKKESKTYFEGKFVYRHIDKQANRQTGYQTIILQPAGHAASLSKLKKIKDITTFTCNYRNVYAPAFESLVLIASMSSEGSDEPVLTHSLARGFASHAYTKMGVKERCYECTRRWEIDKLRIIHANQTSMYLDHTRSKGEVGAVEHI